MIVLPKPVLFAAALLPASMVIAQTAPPTTAAPGNSTITVEGKKEKKVCRNYPAPTGSRFGGGRVCKTADEWRIEEAKLNQTLNREDTIAKANRAQDWNDKNQGGFGKPLPR